MTSIEVKINNSVIRQFDLYCFKIEKKLYHLTSTFLSHGNQTPIYMQIYILNIAEQLNVRRANNDNLNSIIIDNF